MEPRYRQLGQRYLALAVPSLSAATPTSRVGVQQGILVGVVQLEWLIWRYVIFQHRVMRFTCQAVRYTYIACYEDTHGSGQTRILNGTGSSLSTAFFNVEDCLSFCGSSNYKYAGIEGANCWCDNFANTGGNNVVHVGSNACQTSCSGLTGGASTDPFEWCGATQMAGHCKLQMLAVIPDARQITTAIAEIQIMPPCTPPQLR